MARAQITLFIIIGIVVLAVIVFFIVILAGRKAGVFAPTVRPALLRSVHQYITDCFQNSLYDSLEIAGLQGLRIEVSLEPEAQQHTPLPRRPGHPVLGAYQVPYAVRASSQPFGPYEPRPHLYPWYRFPYEWFGDAGKVKRLIFTGNTYGKLNFPPLYKTDGEGSLQEQLETDVLERTTRCAQLAAIFEPQGLEFVSIGEPAADIIIETNLTRQTSWFGKEGVRAMLSWNITIEDSTTGGKADLREYTVNANVRLGKIYYHLTKGILGQEVTNITHSITDYSEISVRKDEKGADDLIVFKDSDSLLRGQPYEVHFMRQNRQPALFWVLPEPTEATPPETPKVPQIYPSLILQSCIGTQIEARQGTSPAGVYIKFIHPKDICGVFIDYRLPPDERPLEPYGGEKFQKVLTAIDPDEDEIRFCYVVEPSRTAERVIPNKPITPGPLHAFRQQDIGPNVLRIAACDMECDQLRGPQNPKTYYYNRCDWEDISISVAKAVGPT